VSRSESERLARTPSGKTLFIGTLAAVVVSLGLAVVTGLLGLPSLAFALPVLWFAFLIVLLYLSGRAISAGRRPGEAGTSLLLAVLLTPVVTLAPAASFVPVLVERFSGITGQPLASPIEEDPATALQPTPESTEGPFSEPSTGALEPVEGNFEQDVTIEPATEDGAGDVQCNATVTNPANAGFEYAVVFTITAGGDVIGEASSLPEVVAPGESIAIEGVSYVDYVEDAECSVESVEVYDAF